MNGAAVEVDENGGFSVVVWLSPGANTIYVATADAAGNRDETSVGVTYTDPAAGVEQALATAQADLSQAQADLSQAQADLSEAQAHILLLELQQNQTTNTLRDATADNVALAGQVTTLSIVAFASLIAGTGALGLALVMARRGAGGEGGGSAERVYSKRKFSEQELEEKKQG